MLYFEYSPLICLKGQSPLDIPIKNLCHQIKYISYHETSDPQPRIQRGLHWGGLQMVLKRAGQRGITPELTYSLVLIRRVSRPNCRIDDTSSSSSIVYSICLRDFLVRSYSSTYQLLPSRLLYRSRRGVLIQRYICIHNNAIKQCV